MPSVLLTGASSFSGLHFARALSQPSMELQHLVWNNHPLAIEPFYLVAPLRERQQSHIEILRTHELGKLKKTEFPKYSGMETESFLSIIQSCRPDVLWLHGAFMDGYRSKTYDVRKALETNFYPIQAVLSRFQSSGGRLIVYSGSLFEPHEGEGDDTGHAVSPYGVSKLIVYEWIRYWCHQLKIGLLKVVIPNPIGTWENIDRLIPVFIRHWKLGKTPTLEAPYLIRDNIPARWLALHAVRKIKEIADQGFPPGEWRVSPSGIVAPMETFTYQMSREIGKRLNLETAICIPQVSSLSAEQPIKRINTESCSEYLAFDQAASLRKFWDELADYYRERSL